MAPVIKPWFDAGAYPSLYGQTDVERTTFAEYGQPCASGPRSGKWDAAVSGLPKGAGAAGVHSFALSLRPSRPI